MAVLTFQMHHVRLNDDVSQAARKWRHLHPPVRAVAEPDQGAPELTGETR